MMDEPKSKSQKKRDADFLQQIGVDLIGLTLGKLDLLPLSPQLKKAIVEAKSLKSHGAMRRQAQLIGKLMRNSDHEEIIAAYNNLLADENAQTASFHLVEQWRERLMSEGKQALTEFIAAHPVADVQQVRHLIKKAINAREKEQDHGESKALFRYLRSCQ